MSSLIMLTQGENDAVGTMVNQPTAWASVFVAHTLKGNCDGVVFFLLLIF